MISILHLLVAAVGLLVILAIALAIAVYRMYRTVAALDAKTRGNVDADLVRSIATLTAAEVAPKSLDMDKIAEKANVNAREAANQLIAVRLADWEAKELIREAAQERRADQLIENRLAEMRVVKVRPRHEAKAEERKKNT